MKRIAVGAVGLLVVAVVVMAVSEGKSGLKEGDAVGPYLVKDCTGPNEGKTLCYR